MVGWFRVVGLLIVATRVRVGTGLRVVGLLVIDRFLIVGRVAGFWLVLRLRLVGVAEQRPVVLVLRLQLDVDIGSDLNTTTTRVVGLIVRVLVVVRRWRWIGPVGRPVGLLISI
jgi:hypothetical protein